MDKQKRYWAIGIAVAVIIVLIIVFSAMSRKNANTPADPHGEHSQEETSQAGGTSSPASQTQESGSSNASEESGEALSKYLSEQDKIMADMMNGMAVEPTGNASLDYLKGMIPHHESAIDMSESYLKYGGSNPDLKQLAEDIINAQTDEINQMNRLIQEIESSGKKDEEKEKKYLEAYNKMMEGHQHMGHGTSSAKDVEQAFAEGMMMHHQMAVDMSKAILEYTDNDEVLQLAEDIIDAQEDEIKLMQDILK